MTPALAEARRWHTRALLGMLAVFGAQLAWVRIDNFGGYDEWLVHWLSHRRIVDCPYANRPLVFLWSLPGSWMTPHGFAGYHLLHAAYLAGAGFLVYFLCRRLAPEDLPLAFLAGVFAMIWAPLDHARLSPVQMIVHSGTTFGTYLAIVFFLVSWQRRSRAWLLAACVAAIVAGRAYESALPLLVAAPLLLRAADPPARWRSLAAWSAPWAAVVLICAALFARPLLFAGERLSYQTSVVRFDPNPWRLGGRLLRQLEYHLLPLVTGPEHTLLVAAVPVAVVVFVAAFAWLRGGDGDAPRATYVRLMAAGLLGGVLSYGAFVASPEISLPHRVQFLSTPSIGLFLAAAVRLVGHHVRARARSAWAALVGGWIVAVSTANVVSAQAWWDTHSFYAAQRNSLRQIVEQVPDTKPNTLLLLIEDRKAWPANFAFRHAVDYLYQGRAVGTVWNNFDFLYPMSVADDGVRCEPWKVIQQPWAQRPSLHRYDEVIVLRLDRAARLSVLGTWPAAVLPALPAGARYEPHARILHGGTPPPARAILRGGPRDEN